MSKLTKVFSSVLGLAEGKIVPELSPDNCPTWDSLNAIILLTEIEKALGLRFKYDEAMSIKNFKDVMNLVVSKGIDPNV